MFFPQKLTFNWIKNAYENGLTPKALIEEIILRAEKTKDYNIWITPPSMDISLKYIEALPESKEDYPLWGIPFAIKDNIDLADVPTTAACPDYSYIPQKSAFVVERLIRAGAIPVGKTNLDQFATGLVGTRSPYGEVHNSYQPEMISGGSSSGSAVSVAMGMAAFSLGTDTAGSGRVPAMLNSLVGYKPPLGSWSTAGVVPACASLDCVTVFANSLEETEKVDKVARGYDTECCWSRVYEQKGKKLPDVIYLPKEEPVFYGTFKDIYRQKWYAALERIKSLGIKTKEIDYSMFSEAALILYEGAYVAERWQDLKEFIKSHKDSIFPVTDKILRSGGREECTAARLFEDLHRLQEYRHRTQELLKNAVMLMPTAGGSFTRDEVRESPIETNSLMGLYTNHCNLLDLFAIALPENSTDKTYPFGITIFGLSDSENLVTALGEKFMQSEKTKLAVCGLHKKGRELEYQLTELGAEFVEHTKTAPNYRLYKLNTSPVKPGLVRDKENVGEGIEIDIYSIDKTALGKFMDNVKMPLLIGDIITCDGNVINGFLCETTDIDTAEDITQKGRF